MNGEIVTTGVVSRELGVDYKTVRNWIECGVRGVKLVARRTGWKYQIRRGDLDDFLAACEGKPVVTCDEPTPTERDRINRKLEEQLIAEGW